MIIEYILYFLIIAAGIPFGLMIFKLCKEEIKNWITRLIIISFAALAAIILVALTSFDYKTPITAGLLFIIAFCLTIVGKFKKIIRI
jgi:hypothetical protein